MNVEKRIFITAANSNFGVFLSEYFAKQGFQLALHFRESSSEIRRLKEKFPQKIVFFQSDFNEISEVEKMCHLVKKEFVEIDVLINNAASFCNDFPDGFSEESFNSNFNLNLKAPMFVSSFFQKNLAARNANIVNILDYCIFKMPQKFTSYSLSKMALANFTKMSAVNFAPNVRVNGVSFSNLLKNAQENHERFEKNASNNLLGQQTSVEEILAIIQLILNSPTMTGQIINVDGGKSLSDFPYYE